MKKKKFTRISKVATAPAMPAFRLISPFVTVTTAQAMATTLCSKIIDKEKKKKRKTDSNSQKNKKKKESFFE